MALLIETAQTFDLILEAKEVGGRKVYVAAGLFGDCSKPTKNGRLYSREIVSREVARLQESITQRKLLGELDHPADGFTKLQRVSHLLTNLRMEGDKVYGELEILSGTPNGAILEALYRQNVSIGVSSRGFGSLKNEGDYQSIGDDFELKTYDVVYDPAVAEANPSLKEAIEEASHTPAMTLDGWRNQFPEMSAEFEALIRDSMEKKVEGQLDALIAKARDEFAKQQAESVEDDLNAVAMLGEIGRLVSKYYDGGKDGDASKIERLEAALVSQKAAYEELERLSMQIGCQLVFERLANESMIGAGVRLFMSGAGYDDVDKLTEDFRKTEKRLGEINFRTEAQRKKESLDAELLALKQENQSLKEEAESLKLTEKSLEEAKRKLVGFDSFRDEIDRLTKENAALEQRLASSVKVVEDQSKAIDNARLAEDLLKAKLAKLELVARGSNAYNVALLPESTTEDVAKAVSAPIADERLRQLRQNLFKGETQGKVQAEQLTETNNGGVTSGEGDLQALGLTLADFAKR